MVSWSPGPLTVRRNPKAAPTPTADERKPRVTAGCKAMVTRTAAEKKVAVTTTLSGDPAAHQP